MKYRQIMLIVGLAVGTVLYSGCSGTTQGTSSSVNASSEAEDADTIYGEVTALESGSITIQVGTKKTMDMSGKSESKDTMSEDTTSKDTTAEDATSEDTSSEAVTSKTAVTEESSAEDSSAAVSDSSDETKMTDRESNPGDGESEPPSGEKGMSILDLTDEENTIVLTDDTTYVKSSMGGMGGGMPSGQAPSDSGAGDAPSDAGSGEVPEKPDGDTTVDGSQEVPEKPDGDTTADGSQEATEKSDEAGTADGSDTMPKDQNQASDQQTETITLDDLAIGDTVSITLDADGHADTITLLSMDMGRGTDGMDGGMGGSTGVESYTAATTYSEDTSTDGETYTSTGTDENTILVDSNAEVSITAADISKTSEDSTGGDNSSFYGVGAALLTTDGTTSISNSVITTDSAGGAGIFAYGDGTVYAADTTITTQQDTSGGIHAAGGGTLYAWDLTAETHGTSSAAIRSDRGGGTMVIDGGTYTSQGADSPAVYCTADIAVNNATLTSTAAEAVCIEGLNTLHLYDCDLTGALPDDDRNDCVWNVILYQSMSGDSEVGNSTFEMNGGTLTANNGGMFYTTNTESTFTLKDVDITYAADNAFFLKCTGNNNSRGWGTVGENGADSVFTAIDQAMEGDIIWDSISTLDFYMTGQSTLTGAVLDDESSVGSTTGDGSCTMVIASDSTWIVTGDSTVTTLMAAGTIKDADGKTVTIKGSDGTVYVDGTGSYTITVETYQNNADMSGAGSATSWSDHEVDRPSDL